MYRLLAAFVLIMATTFAQAADYVIDTKDDHAFIQFRIQHFGFSWLWGRFNQFEGRFTYDRENPSESSVTVSIDPASIDTNHAERDKHLRGEDFLAVGEFPEAKFVSTGYKEHGDGTATLEGDLTLHGVTRGITIDVEKMGHGEDPWGGYRRGFSGRTTLKLSNFGIDYDLGPASREVEIIMSLEGVRQ